MEKNKTIIKGSFKGISADLTKNVLILVVTWIVYLLSNSYKDKLYEKNQISSFLAYLLEMDKLTVVCTIAIIYLIIIITVIVAISSLIKIIGILYHLADCTTFDFENKKVISKTFSFPFNMTTDENKLDEVINVNIEQGSFHRLFNTGNVYIEFLAYNSVDTQLRNLEIKCVALPFMQKNKIM